MVAGAPRSAAYGPAYLPRRQRRCFYCGAPLVPASCFPDGVTQPDNLATTDHVYPRRLCPKSAPDAWFRKNKVRACLRCNGDKGDMAPTLWLQIVPRASRGRLMDRLAALERLI